MTQRRSQSARLSRAAEFQRVYRHGKSQANDCLVLYAFPTSPAEAARVGLSVPRKVGGAVQRNRVKRLLRETFKGAQGSLRGGYDIVVVARPAVAELADRRGLAGVASSLEELLRRTDLLDASYVADHGASAGGSPLDGRHAAPQEPVGSETSA